jgi:hypothetical protein
MLPDFRATDGKAYRPLGAVICQISATQTVEKILALQVLGQEVTRGDHFLFIEETPSSSTSSSSSYANKNRLYSLQRDIYVCFLFCVFCVFVSFCLLFPLFYIVVSFLFL